MSTPHLVRFYHPERGNCVGVQIDATVYEVTEHIASVGAFLRHSVGHVADAITGLQAIANDSAYAYPTTMFDEVPEAFVPHWLAPSDEQEIWAAGVTYE